MTALLLSSWFQFSSFLQALSLSASVLNFFFLSMVFYTFVLFINSFIVFMRSYLQQSEAKVISISAFLIAFLIYHFLQSFFSFNAFLLLCCLANDLPHTMSTFYSDFLSSSLFLLLSSSLALCTAAKLEHEGKESRPYFLKQCLGLFEEGGWGKDYFCTLSQIQENRVFSCR